jgi:guanine deaminase
MTIFQGNIFYCSELTQYHQIENGYLIVDDNGLIEDIGPVLPKKYAQYPVERLGNQILLPAFCDIHLHSSQFVNTGLGYDILFEDWMRIYTYPAEQRYQELDKAEEINRRLIRELWKYGTMNAVIMGSTDAPSTWNLMKLYNQTGMSACIGKMNADVAGFGNQAEDTAKSILETISLIEQAEKLRNITYCISPEFIPNCSDELMERLGDLAVRYGLPVQSHISESEGDVRMVRERYGKTPYAKVYQGYRLFGQTPTVMAHGIYLTKQERVLMKRKQVTLAHCPVAISNIPSGKTIPLRRFLEEGVNVGLGSDIGGGHTLNMMRIMESTVHYSKFQQLIDHSRPLSILEAFALATVCAGKVFGRTGSFKAGLFFDGLVIDDKELSPASGGYSIRERVERFLYEGDYRYILKRYCRGKLVKEPFANREPELV